MRLDFSSYHQFTTIFLSVVLGAAFCLMYDLLRYFHFAKKTGNAVIFLLDVLYFAVIGIITFCFFVLYCKGTIRIYVFIGELCGFVLCRNTLSKLFMRVLKAAEWLVRLIIRIVLLPVNFVFGIAQKITKALRKILKRLLFKLYTVRQKVKREKAIKRQNKQKQKRQKNLAQKNSKLQQSSKNASANGLKHQKKRFFTKKRKKLRKSP